MTKKDYDRAAEIVRECRNRIPAKLANQKADLVEEAFIGFFCNYDNPRFDATRFHEACQIAKVKKTG